jgi:hypothetical protein
LVIVLIRPTTFCFIILHILGPIASCVHKCSPPPATARPKDLPLPQCTSRVRLRRMSRKAWWAASSGLLSTPPRSIPLRTANEWWKPRPHSSGVPPGLQELDERNQLVNFKRSMGKSF